MQFIAFSSLINAKSTVILYVVKMSRRHLERLSKLFPHEFTPPLPGFILPEIVLDDDVQVGVSLFGCNRLNLTREALDGLGIGAIPALAAVLKRGDLAANVDIGALGDPFEPVVIVSGVM